MTEEVVNGITNRYIELYENITGEKFVPADTENADERIYNNVMNWLKETGKE